MYRQVTKFIQNNFSDREAEDAAEDLQLVDDLRKAVVEKTAPLEARKDSLTKCACRFIFRVFFCVIGTDGGVWNIPIGAVL